MDINEKPTRANPYIKANIISRVFLTWLFPLFREGYRKTLEIEDVYDSLKEDSSKDLGDQLENLWMRQLELQKEKGGRKPSLFRALASLLGWDYCLMLVGFAFSELIFRVLPTLLLRELLLSFGENSSVDTATQYLLAGAISLTTIGITVTFHPSCQYAFMISMKCRIACSSLLYRKALRLSKSAQGKTTVGQITNLLSNDVNRFDYNLFFTTFIPLGILQMGIFTVFLYKEFGVACFSGIAVTLALVPIQYWNGRYSTKCRLQIAQRTDERGRIMNEIIIAMKIIKQYTWEKPFSAIVNKLRVFEGEALMRRLHLRGFYLSMYMSTLKLVIFLTVLTYVLQDKEPTADKVFFLASAYFTIIQSVIYMIPNAISGIGEIRVSLNRLENFLLLDEKSDGSNLMVTSTSINENTDAKENITKPMISLDSVSATWTGERMNLSDVSMKVEGDKVVVVVGAVGSGKTSLLHVLLGELPIAKGKCHIQGSISYASQESWVFQANVQQNILFGREKDNERYKTAVKYAELEDDFKQLAYSDQTYVGDRGVSLSGGQKARVNLARALYQPADIYLLDDPLSAVDSKVSRRLFEKCIKQHLKGKLRILITHQLQYLPQADHVVVLQNGSVAAQGTYDELVKAGIDFVSLMATDEEEASLSRQSSLVRKGPDQKNEPPLQLDEIDYEGLEESKNLRTEKKVSGAIGSAIYVNYMKTAKSPVLFFWVAFCFLVCQIALSGSDYWLSYWTTAEARHIQGKDETYLGRNVYIWVYAGLVAAVVIFNLFRSVGFFSYCIRISVEMHNLMFTRLIRSPSKFFDDNPSGRVMNRFTKDLGSVDETLPPAFIDMVLIFSNVVGVFVIIIISNYYAVIPTVVVVVLLIFIQRYYVTTARDIKRIEGLTKSPIFTHSSATFQGLTTIRSAKAEPILISQFDKLQDVHTASWFLFFSTARCFGVWVEIIGIIFMTIVTFSFLLLQNASDGGNLGLAITSAMSITGWLQYGMRQSAEVENLMTSVERCLEYANLPSEAELESTPDRKPSKEWPTSGAIRFSNVYLAYEEKDVLKNLTFDIKAREKIGVVGRTGAGKSSIIQALFRMTEPRGDIIIDGINIQEIGLHDLRRAISIIPQDPVLFSGTMRYNLDPFNEYPDDEVWKAIEEVQLKSEVPALDYLVADSGSNFSLGQRQLVCLARAILRKNKIIVMDEITANCDMITDNLIQQTIRSKFASCSIITVAHRLRSVIDCDRILVLDNGFVREYDHPHVLLQDPSGILTTMVHHTGKSSGAMLRKIAAETFYKKRGSFDADSVKELTFLDEEKSEKTD